MGDIKSNINFKQWKRGLIIAAITGLVLVMMNLGMLQTVSIWNIIVFICTTTGTSMFNYLQKHPIDEVADTTFIKKDDSKPQQQ